MVRIGKLAARDNGTGRQFNHKFIKVKAEVKNKVTIRGTIRTGIDQIIDPRVVIKDNTEVGLGMNKIFGEKILKKHEKLW